MKTTKIITLLFLSSCAFFSHHKIDYDSLNNFPVNKKANVILKLTSSPALQMTSWCKFNSAPLEKEVCTSIKPEPFYKILVLEPGIYEISALEKINYRNKVTIQKIDRDFSNITHKRRAQPTILFDASQGKINYVGHIKYHEYSTKIQVEDNFAQIEDALNNKNFEQFKHYEFEANFVQNHKRLIVKNLAKTKADLSDEKKVKKDSEKSYKKKSKEFAKKKKSPKANLKNYEN